MRRAPVEFGAQIAAGVAHDRIIVAKGCGERIELRGRFLVRRVGLAGLDGAPGGLHSDEAVSCSERGPLGRNGRGFDERFELRDRCPARETIGPKIMPRPHAEIGQIARNAEFRALIENAGIEDVAGHVDVAVQRDRGVIDKRVAARRLAVDRSAADADNGAVRCRRRRRRHRGMLNRIAFRAAGVTTTAPGLDVAIWLTCSRSWAFSFASFALLRSSASSRAMTSSSVADRAAPLNATRQSAAQAVPERSFFLMTFPRFSNRIQLPGEGSIMYTKCQRKAAGRAGYERFVNCHKNGTLVLLQCSILSQLRAISVAICSGFAPGIYPSLLHRAAGKPCGGMSHNL